MPSPSEAAHVVQINVNPQGGVPKHHVPSVAITGNGVTGDKQRDRRYHGGPKRAVCLYSAEHIETLRAEGHPIAPGTTGENLTVRGLDWPTLRPGVRLRVGDEVELEITTYAAPCRNIAGSFHDEEFTRISQKLHPGWSRVYTRVLREGRVHEGDSVTLI